MKVIFLDFDGVINDYISINEINDYNVVALKRIIDETNAKVVVTSSHKYIWQKNNNIEGLSNSYYIKGLKEKGINVFDYTPFIKHSIKDKREQEILEYLKSHPEITQYVILDDDYIIESLKEHEIFLDLQAGLKEKHIIPAIRILNGQLNFYHDCADEQLSETSEERLIRMNEIFHKILNGQLNFYHDCTDEQLSKTIEGRIDRMRERISSKSEKNIKKQDNEDIER